jgi:hypothetical protein
MNNLLRPWGSVYRHWGFKIISGDAEGISKSAYTGLLSVIGHKM